MKLNLNKLIKKEILITAGVVLFLTLLFVGFTRAIYRTTSEGQTNTVVYGNLEIQMCTDASCASIASNLGNIVGMTDNISFTSNMYPKSEAEAMLGTPYSFVVKNVGQYDAYVDLISEYDWADENPGSSLVTNYSGVMIAYKKDQDENYQIRELNQFTIATQLFKNFSLASGESQIFHVLVWASEEASNEIIDRIFITKIKTSGYYIPDDPNGLHNDLDNTIIAEETDHIDFEYTGNFQEFIAPKMGTYKIELWGAQGEDSTSKGAYTRGLIQLSKKEKMYIYVGEGLHSTANSMAFNNGVGSSDGVNGGGATDVRLTAGNWNDPYSLNSRIMVAAGSGAGSGNNTTLLGAGGGLTGYAGGSQAGTQTNFGSSTFTGSQFGIASGECTGGNGYYPGGGATCESGAGGGSSYISGHQGCIAINAENDISNPRTIKTGCTSSSTSEACSTHYSGKSFHDTKMIDGAGYAWTTVKLEREPMPNPAGGYYSAGTGRAGNGYARITYMPSLVRHTITFNLNGGTQSSNYTGLYYEGEQYYIEVPSKPGYNFTGWTISDTSTSIVNNLMDVGTQNTTITANWEMATYTITYNLMGGSITNYTTYTVESPSFTLNNPSKPDYIFAGWTGSNGNTPQLSVTIPQGSYGNKNYTANWFKIINNFDFISPNGGEQTFEVPLNGVYIIELWGGNGGVSGSYQYGGAYTKGEIELSNSDILYINVGGRGCNTYNDYCNACGTSGYLLAGGWNGGGSGHYAGCGLEWGGSHPGGGGATDVRINDDTLKARIMVAAGAGAAEASSINASGGGLANYPGNTTQTYGYSRGGGQEGSSGTYNCSGSSCWWNSYPTSGSGGGYMGAPRSGSGGSSFISGHTGSIAVDEFDRAICSDTKTAATSYIGTTDATCSVHYSNKTFDETVMIDGAGYSWSNKRNSLVQMPNPSGGLYESGYGHRDNGYARITYKIVP